MYIFQENSVKNVNGNWVSAEWVKNWKLINADIYFASSRDHEMNEDGNKDVQREESIHNERDVSDTDSDCDDVPSLSSVSDDSSGSEDDCQKVFWVNIDTSSVF